MIDYADHLIRIELQTKRASTLCLDRKFKEAREAVFELVTEARLLLHVLDEMQRKEDDWK